MAVRNAVKIFTALKQREGGGFVVRRSVGSAQMNVMDPFLMLDHLGPSVYGPGEAVGAPDHPHRGFETVTYVLEGGFHHKDNAGNEGWLRKGWAQWMTAGRGVIHSEMPTEELLEKGGTMEGFQLWVNLPAKDKMIEPRYQDTPPEKLPKVALPDGHGQVTIIAGQALNTKAVIDTRSPMMFLDVQIEKDGIYEDTVPSEYDGFVYVYRGKGLFGSNEAKANEGQYFALSAGNQFVAKTADDEGVRFLLVAGKPLREPVERYGPFVMNTKEQIRQAFEDYQSGRFGKPIEGSEERFAKTKGAVNAQQKSGRYQRDQEDL